MILLGKSKPERITVICPACDHEQREYAEANSTFCHACGHRFQLHSKRLSSYRKPDNRVKRRKFFCPECEHELFIPESAMSWQCQHCTTYVDLKSYTIDKAMAKSIHTFGEVVITPKGSFQAAKLVAENLTIRGRCAGSLRIQDTLIVDSQVKLSGSVSARSIIVEPGASLATDTDITASRWHVEGEVKAGRIHASQELVLAGAGALRSRILEYSSVKIFEGARAEVAIATPLEITEPPET
jgi:cytoskeletal protein CcmA (bactofilin family)/ribosomal protein L37AE/L43A